jgi:Zn-dependent protease with chaperone function
MSAYQSVLTVLGWSLLDSIWQMAVLWIAYNMITADNKLISPAGKHNLILLFVFVGTEWFVYTFIRLTIEPETFFLPGFIPVSSSANRWILCLCLIYLTILLIRLLQQGFHFLGTWRKKHAKLPSPDLQAFADRYSRLLGIHRKVEIYLSRLAETAETSRFFKPLILLPFSLVTRLSTKQLEAILVHELYHIRRNDYPINLCISFYRSIFFFNPFAHLFYKALARERELACDDGVLELGFAPELYAEALFSLEKFRQPQLGFSLAADGNRPWLLMDRIRRVLGKPETRKNVNNPLIIFTGLIAVALLILKPEIYVLPAVANITIKPTAVMPTRYELPGKRIEIKENKEVIEAKGLHKPEKITSQPNAKPSIKAETAENSDPPDQAYFADNNIVRDYTNQPAADLSQGSISVSPGTPYVPSMSLSYEAPPVIVAADSAREIQMDNELREVIGLANMKAIADLKEIELQVEKNKRELTLIELQNQKHFLRDQQNVKPLLKKMQKQLDVKKTQIDRLRVRLEDSELEIIHI